MFIVRVSAKVKPESIENFKVLIQKDKDFAKSLKGCHWFQIYQDSQDQTTFFIYEEWESETDFTAYRESRTVAEAFPKLFELMEDKPRSAYYSGGHRVGP